MDQSALDGPVGPEHIVGGEFMVLSRGGVEGDARRVAELPHYSSRI